MKLGVHYVIRQYIVILLVPTCSFSLVLILKPISRSQGQGDIIFFTCRDCPIRILYKKMRQLNFKCTVIAFVTILFCYVPETE